MSEQKKPGRKRPRQKQIYMHHKNAVCITVYDPSGATIPLPVRRQLEEAVFQPALANKLFINIAYE